MKSIPLKNSNKSILVDDHVYTWLSSDPELQKLGLLANLRLHSSGCGVFQKTIKLERGKYETLTIYIQKLIADKFLSEHKDERRNLVGVLNGNKLDCRLENLVYRSRSAASRTRNTSNKVGYTGVYQENKRFRAVISIDGKSVHLGMFPTAIEAAIAYNKASWEKFGTEGKLNDIPEDLWKK